MAKRLTDNPLLKSHRSNLRLRPARGMFMGMRGGPGSKDPGLFTCNNCNVFMLMVQAYDVQPYQIGGAVQRDGDRFNITAKVPEGATKEQFRLMLQNFLAERFKLKLHRDQKDSPAFDLVVAKNGPKLKESTQEAIDPVKDGLPPLPPGPPKLDKDGLPQLPSGCNGCIFVLPGGRARAQYVNETMEDFAKRLSGQLSKPVTDATGLKGKYDFTVDFSIDMGGRGVPPPPPGVGPGPSSDPAGPANASDPGPTLQSAVQSLGLKLEPKKGFVELIVVDHLEKVPTEN